MATIVRDRDSGTNYVLLGTGFGAFKSARPSVFFGSLIPDEQSGELTMVAVCDATGNIGWIDSQELVVVEVDGRAPSELV